MKESGGVETTYGPLRALEERGHSGLTGDNWAAICVSKKVAERPKIMAENVKELVKGQP